MDAVRHVRPTRFFLLALLALAVALLGAAPAWAAPGGAAPLSALLAVQQAQLTATDGAAWDYFGCSVAVSGDTAVVGASGQDLGTNPDRPGSAYVFVRSGTTWSQQAKLTAADGAEWDYFGYSVAVSGDTAVVGAYRDDIGANTDQGSAYVFVRSGTTWSQQAKLTADDGALGERFGSSVAVSGDTAVVGAMLDHVGANSGQGSAYVFSRSGTTWGQQAKLTADDGDIGDWFGASIALSGDTAVVGAEHDDLGANVDQGSAYAFARSGATWSQQAHLTAADGAAADYFGYSVAVSGDTAVVGAYVDDVGANAHQGSAYVFARGGTTWSQQAQLTAADGAAADYFGYSVAVSGRTAVVGARGDDVGGKADQGSAYAFWRSGTTWSQQDQLTAADGVASDSFGSSVAISGDSAVVGAVFDHVGAMEGQGSAYVFADLVPPSIDSLLHGADTTGERVTLRGDRFGETEGTVSFGGVAAPVANWSDVQIDCAVPAGLAGHVPVVVTRVSGTSSAAADFVVLPKVDGLAPSSGSVGAAVTISGSGLGTATGTVSFGGVAATVTGWATGQVSCAVPAGVSGKLDVVVTTAEGRSATATFSVKPKLTGLAPARGRAGATLTINGSGFGATRGTAKVTVGGKAVATYVLWSDTKIKIKVPRLAKGRKAVKVVTAGGTSNARYFRVI